MAELDVVLQEATGIQKEIDEGAYDLVFQAIQEDIYSFPIKSFVREAISNGLDAITERDIHFKIKNGAPIEDFYRQKQDGSLLKDSDYNPEYYDDKYLSDKKEVLVEYDEITGSRRHIIRITDQGVGLGGSRLRGFFRIGYSSKRNMKDQFGKFGAGAKAGLATGEEYFRMTTVYNGYETSFYIYKADYEPTTVKSAGSKKETWRVKTTNGDTVDKSIYWTPTFKKNGVTIELMVKPHNKSAFISAVTSQFQHFKGRVNLKVMRDGTMIDFQDLNIEPDYESDDIIIPKYSSHYAPTILVDGISYGTISWQDLELENRGGTLAIKTNSTEVDITQSRESLKWTERTKKLIMAKIVTVEEEVAEYLNKELNLSDPYNIFETFMQYKELKDGYDPVISQFRRFLNRKNVKPTYTFKEEWCKEESKLIESKSVLDDELYEALFYSFSVRETRLVINDGRVKIKHESVKSFNDLTDRILVFGKSKYMGPKFAQHILRKYKVDSFVYIRPNPDTFEERLITTLGDTEYSPAEFKTYTLNLLENYVDLNIDDYEFFEEDFDDIDIENSSIEADNLTLAQIRKQNKEIVYRTTGLYSTLYSRTIKKANIEKEIKEFKKNRNVYIATLQYKSLGDIVTRNKEGYVLYVARDLLSEFCKYAPFINDAFYTISEGKLYPSPVIKKLAYRKMIYELMNHEGEITKEFIEMFNDDLRESDALSPPSVDYNRHVGEFTENLIAIYKLQLENKDKEALVLAKDTLNAEVVVQELYDTKIATSYNETKEYLEPAEEYLELINYYNARHNKEKVKEVIELIINDKTQ